MSKTTLIVTLGIVVVFVLVFVGSFVGAYNKGVTYETTIEAQYNDMKNVLGQYSLKVKEAAQIPGMMTDDLSKVMQAAFTGRYGKNGSQAAFQWIKESHPGQLRPELYTNIQQIIEAGRNKFENHQRVFIDQMRAYKNERKYLWSGFWMRAAGYPSQEFLDANYRIIESEHGKATFESGVDQGLKIR